MPRRPESVRRAAAAVVERLESRQLLTTIVGGGMDPLTGRPNVSTFSYLDARQNLVNVFVGGNTTVELIFAQVNGFDVAPSATPGFGTNGTDLFQVYVAAADKDSFVSITEVDPQTGALIPFSGSADFRIVNARTGRLQVVQSNGGTGSLVLGARTPTTLPNAGDIPITSSRFSGPIGARPDLGQRNLVAGLQVADGVDLGRFYFDGTVMGAVLAGGSVEQMYAGNIFTGATTGTIEGGVGRRTPNFRVAGDLHSLVVAGSIGTHTLPGALNQPIYVTDFDAQVVGRVGSVRVGDTFLGGFDAINNPVTQPFGSQVEEVEGISAFSANGTDPEVWALGFLSGSNAIYRNETFATPQILPSYPGRKGRSGVVAHGRLEADGVTQDFVDYYGMPLLAGQSITVSLRPVLGEGFVGLLNVGIFDPDGRLVATDYSNVSTGLNAEGLPIRYTADRPGLYRVAVATAGDADFDGTGGEFGVTLTGDSEYLLSISEAGNLGLGGVLAGNHIYDAQLALDAFGFFVENGDFGGLTAGGTILSGGDTSISVRRGNLRGLDAASIGIAVGGATWSPMLVVPRGTVGLVRASGGNLALNMDFLARPVGGDYQVVSATGTLISTLIANRRIGVIRAGDTATATPSVWTVNADDIGNDGIIDLIDVPGQFGTLAGGGAQITTNTEGNVRYMHVGYSGATVFRDEFFGVGDAIVQYSPGEIVNINDDSGARVELEPFPRTRNPLFTPGGTNSQFIGPTLNVGTYGIRGSGGSAIFDVSADGNVRIGTGGGRGSASHAEIGAINIEAAGNPVVRSTASGSLVFALPTQPTAADTNAVTLDVLMDGSGRMDVWQINGSDFTGIINRTAGEIVNVNANLTPTAVPGFTNNGTIGTLQATSIGIAQNYTGAALNPLGIAGGGNVFPFSQQHTAIVSGNILNIQAAGGVGNIIVNGSIGNISANSGGRNTTGRFEGINAPIFTTDRIDGVNIGQGILPSGSGGFSRAGLYGTGGIGRVVNQGLGSDIRGDIWSASSIASIRLSDGALIGAQIAILTDAAMMRDFAPGVIPTIVQPINQTIYDIGSIEVGGRGGIIGTHLSGASVGPVSVTRGFGIINSFFNSTSSNRYESITAEGYGIRNTLIRGGAQITSVSATAQGKNISVLEYTPSVRQSERTSIDPFFGAEPNAETDLHKFFGTSFHTPQIRGVTEPGMIDRSAIQVNSRLDSVFANTIVNSNINVANRVGSIRTRGIINGLSVTTGQLNSFRGGTDSYGLNFAVAGPIGRFYQAGDVDSTSVIRAVGSSGRIDEFIVDGDLNSRVTSSNTFNSLLVGGDLGPTAVVQSRTPITTQRIKGNIFGTIRIG